MPANSIKKLIFWIPIILFASFIFLKLFFSDAYLKMIQEDSTIEDFQAGFYFLSFLVAMIITFRYLVRRSYAMTGMYFLFAIAMLMICFEEISWGQRIFEIQNPDYFEEHNTQKEISIHNLTLFQHLISEVYILIGFYGAFTWLIIPLLISQEKVEKIKFLYPPWYISSFFLVVFIVYFFLEWIIPLFVTAFGVESMDLGNFFVWRDQEPAELILSLGFLIFLLDTLFKQSKVSRFLKA